MKIITYFGVNIHPADLNSSGIRWVATVNEQKLRADTLDGMKELIRSRLQQPGFDAFIQYGTGNGPFLTKSAEDIIYQAVEKDCSLMVRGIPTNWKIKTNGRWHRLYMNISSVPNNFIKTVEGNVPVTITSKKFDK